MQFGPNLESRNKDGKNSFQISKEQAEIQDNEDYMEEYKDNWKNFGP